MYQNLKDIQFAKTSYSKPKITGLNPSVGNTSGYLIVHVSGANFGVNHPLSYFYVQNTEPCATSNQTNSTKTDNYLNGTNSTGLSNSSNSSFLGTSPPPVIKSSSPF